MNWKDRYFYLCPFLSELNFVSAAYYKLLAGELVEKKQIILILYLYLVVDVLMASKRLMTSFSRPIHSSAHTNTRSVRRLRVLATSRLQ